MSNNNPNSSNKYWFESNVASCIDNGVESAMNNWAGTTNYWFQGTPQGYLQGGEGIQGQSPQNLFLYEDREPTTTRRAYAYGTIV